MATEEPSRSRKRAAGITAALLGGVMVVGSFVGSAADANSLTKPVNDALAAGGNLGTTATMNGREAKLTGPIEDKDAAIEAAQGVYGVRWATFEEGADSAKGLPSVDIQATASGTTLSGSVPAESVKTQLAAQAERIFGPPVTNNLTVDPNLAAPAWLSGLTGALPKFPRIDLGSLSINGPDGLAISGQVPDVGTIDTLKSDLQAALPDVAASIDLTVATPTPTATAIDPDVSIDATGAGVNVSGTVPSQEAKDSLLAQAKRVFGEPVTDNVTIDAASAGSTWFDGLLGVLPQLPEIKAGGLSASVDGLSVSGEVDSTAKVDAVKTALAGAVTIPATVNLTAPSVTPSATPTPTPTVEQVDPSVAIDATGAGVSVSGTVPSQEAKDSLLAQAKRIFGEPISDNVKVNASSAGSTWFDGLLGALPRLPAITGGTLTATGDGLRLSGKVDAATTIDKATATLKDAVSLPATVSLTAPSPKPTPAAVPAEVIKSINGTTVWYPTSSFQLSKKDKKKLDAAIANLKKYKSIKVEVDGFVSLPHNEATRVPFSKARAQSVKDYLVAGGIDAKRITVAGKGAAKPIASNDTEAGRLKNQRATLVVKES